MFRKIPNTVTSYLINVNKIQNKFDFFQTRLFQSYEDNEEIMSIYIETEFQPIERQSETSTTVRNGSIDLQPEPSSTTLISTSISTATTTTTTATSSTATATNDSIEFPVKPTSVRSAKPPTPIPKSFCSIDNSDEDDDDDEDNFNPFKVRHSCSAIRFEFFV